MSEVRYSVNGKYFKDFGMYISDSDGLFDGLKRKKINTYDWAEYNGSAPDLSNPKFEPREITLKGFVVGDNWLLMKSNFDSILTEFQKSGTQRLLIEPLGLKALPFEVYLEDSTPLNKSFKDRKMVGTFTLKLTEPNPIKKVLYFTGNTLNLSYTSPKETEISYGNGLKDVVKTNASISGKNLVDVNVSGYSFAGRNLLKNSTFKNTLYWGVVSGTIFTVSNNTAYIESNASFKGVSQFNGVFIQENIDYNISFKVKFTNVSSGGTRVLLVGAEQIPNSFIDTSTFPTDSEGWSIVTFTKKSPFTGNSSFLIMGTGGTQHFYIKEIKFEKGTKPTFWKPAPEDEKYIIIAGNIDEITNLTTNAEVVLWERL